MSEKWNTYRVFTMGKDFTPPVKVRHGTTHSRPEENLLAVKRRAAQQFGLKVNEIILERIEL